MMSHEACIRAYRMMTETYNTQYDAYICVHGKDVKKELEEADETLPPSGESNR